MGDYTGLRFRAPLKRHAIPIIHLLNHAQYKRQNAWDRVARRYPHPALVAWARVGRCGFIPFGALCYMPDEWERQAADGHSLLEDGDWLVVCSLKNCGEIEQFLLHVLPLLIDRTCPVEQLFEYDDHTIVTMVEPHAFELDAPAVRKELPHGQVDED